MAGGPLVEAGLRFLGYVLYTCSLIPGVYQGYRCKGANQHQRKMLIMLCEPFACIAQRKDNGYDFGMDRPSLRDLINSALPLARGITGDFWDVYVEHEQEMLYPLELFAAIALECHGLSRCVLYALWLPFRPFGAPRTFLQLLRQAALR